MEKKMDILKRVLFFLLIGFALFIMWKISISGGITPEEQWTKDGWFEVDGRPVRGIRMYVEPITNEGIGEIEEFTIWITSENGNKVWEKTYHQIPIVINEVNILEEYERGEGIEIEDGKYQIHNTLTKDSNISVSHKIMMYDGSYRGFYGICVTIALLFLAIILAITMCKNGKCQLAVAYFVALVLMGTLFTVIMPPLTVPDEESHFFVAYDLSNRIMHQEETDIYGNRIMRETDKDSITYLHNAASIRRWYATLLEPVDVDKMTVNSKWASVSPTTPGYTYFAAALGISFARICKMNGHWLLLMGRLLNLLVVAAIMAVGLHLVPFAKKYFCILGLLPEVVYLAASYSYDALNLALCFLAFAYFFYMISGDKKVKLFHLAIFVGIIIIMIPIKLVYILFLGLLILVPIEKLQINKKALAGIGSIAIACVVFFLIMRWKDVVVLLNGLDYNTEEVHVSLRYILENPKTAIYVLINNFMQNIDYYVCSIAGEFVGRDRYEVLLDLAYLPQWMMIVIGILLAMGIYTEEKADLSIGKKLWVIVISAGSCLLIWLSMYLANNTVDMNIIHGVQGRYFLPILLLLPALFGKKEQIVSCKECDRNNYIIFAVGIDIIAIFVQLQHLIVDYYV